MNRFEQHLREHTSTIGLTHAEKTALWSSLETLIQNQPLGSMKSPLKTPWGWGAYATRILAVLAVFAIACTGTAYAAQNALPGDALYAVKLNVNEALAQTLAFSPAAKASVDASIAAERLNEGQQLAAEGKLTASTTAQLESNFDVHASAALAYAAQVSASDPAQAAQLQAQIGSLSAQGDVLADLGASTGTAATETYAMAFAENAKAAVAVVSPHPTAARAAVVASGSSSVAAPMALSASSNVDAAAASQVKASALQTLSALEDSYASIRTSLDASTSRELDARIAAAQQLITVGDAASSSGVAIGSYGAALTESNMLQTFIDAEVKFKRNLLPSLLSGTSSLPEATSTSAVDLQDDVSAGATSTPPQTTDPDQSAASSSAELSSSSTESVSSSTDAIDPSSTFVHGILEEVPSLQTEQL